MNRRVSGRSDSCAIGFLALVLGAAGAVGCGANAETAPGSTSDLVGGRVATKSEFPSTLLIGTNCTAAKVGRRHILTAAHCVVEGNESPGAIRALFQPGSTLFLTTDVAANSSSPRAPEFFTATVAKTSAHPSYLREQATGGNLGPNPSADVAIIELTDDALPKFDRIPTAVIDTKPVVPGDKLVIMGYGCETGLNAGFDYANSRLKVQSTSAMTSEAALTPDRFPQPPAEARTPQNYFFTPGAALKADAASLCPGDSGGPVYRDDGVARTIVGVNAYYNFHSWDTNVSLTNWHTRLDRDALEGVGDWLSDLVPTP